MREVKDAFDEVADAEASDGVACEDEGVSTAARRGEFADAWEGVAVVVGGACCWVFVR